MDGDQKIRDAVQRMLERLGLGCRPELEQHLFRAKIDENGRREFPDGLRCICGGMTHAEYERLLSAADRDDEALVSHDAQWGDRYRLN